MLPAILSAQVDTAWVRRYDGPGNLQDKANAIAVDGSGNVYITGYCSKPDFTSDYATIKYYANGDTAWLRRYDGPIHGDDAASAIAVDGSGNVYITGGSAGSGGLYDYATIKYNANGDTTWVRRYDGPGPSGNDADEAKAIAVDGSGNVYVTGGSYGSGTDIDYTTIKYYANGDTAWIRRYNGPASYSDEACGIAVDGSGNVYITGYSYWTPTERVYATIKYYANGDTAWFRRYNGPGVGSEVAKAIAVDGSGKVYVTGLSYNTGTGNDYATIKYYANGDTAWVRRYNGPGNSVDQANAIAIDGSGNVYITGASYGSGTAQDYATIKYYGNGDTTWVRRYNGLGNNTDVANAIAVDGSGNIYITGYSIGSVTSDDYATIKYCANGDTAWVRRYNGPANGSDQANTIAVNGSGYVCITGYSAGLGGYDDYATIKYVQSHTITAMTVGGGTIIPSGEVIVNHNSDTTFSILPSTGYHIDSVVVDNENIGTDSVYIFTNVITDHLITAYFSIDYYSLTMNIVGNGTAIRIPDSTYYPYGTEVWLNAIPDTGYAFIGWSGSINHMSTPTTIIMDTNKNITATFILGGWYQKESIQTGVAGKYVKAGGSLVAVPSGSEKTSGALYAFRGNKKKEFYKYDAGWTLKESLLYGTKPPPDTLKINKKQIGKGAAMCFDNDHTIYATKGNGTRELWAYDINTGIWTQKAFVPVPKALKGGTSISYLNGKVYLLAGSQKKTDPDNFYVYDVASNTWTTGGTIALGPSLKPFKDGSCITEMGGNIYTLKGGDKGNYFYAYDTTTSTWFASDSMPLGDSLYGRWKKKLFVKDGAAMTNDGSTIYMVKGGGTNVFWKYVPMAGWSRRESIPRLNKKSVVKTGGALAYLDGAIWLLKGNNTPEFWKYIEPAFTKERIANHNYYAVQSLDNNNSVQNTNFDLTPNPFTKFTTIHYAVPISGTVSIKLYNTAGRLIQTINDGYLNAGIYTTTLSAKNLTKGVYLLRYTDNTYQKEIKLIVE